MPESKYRFLVLKIIAVFMLIAIGYKLFDLQIINGESYLKSASSRLTTSVVNRAPRGDILDRYGNVLVSNKTGYCVVLQKHTSDNAELNEEISRVVEILYTTGNTAIDTMPISIASPYEFMFEDENSDGSTEDEKAEWLESNSERGLTPDMSAEEVMVSYCKRFEIQGNVYDAHTRYIAGIRYEAEQKNFSVVNPVTIAEDINVEAVTQIKEKQNSLKGVSITEEYVRVYNKPGFATHILGRVGKISAEEYKDNAAKGYAMDDIIGKQGIERWAEGYLRGKNGTSGTTTRVDGNEVEMSEDIEPVPGNYIMLTLDSELQQTLESSLANRIRAIGGDCDSGAAVVLDVNSGDVLAMSSYPTYDMSRFNEDYNELLANTANPMINRAVSGLYSPGSTFKPLTAIAGIQSGNLDLWERIDCTGVYTFYEDYQPTCWIWSESKLTHGAQDVSVAIENSCNVFFYELGRRMGIDTLDEYAKLFGMGEYTGIQLTEEASGHMASPEYKSEVVRNVVDSEWFGGDTLQAAIGQSYSLFTPLQIANYCATVANGGTRYKVNIINSIRSSVDGSLVEEFEPTVEEQIDISPKTLTKIHDGMKRVVDEGSASSIFDGYPMQVGGKTGTAQLGSGANNAIFMAFAPFDNPQIAVAIVLEHGVRGANAGQVARDVFDKYFFDEGSPNYVANPTATEQAGPVAATQAPVQLPGLR